MRKKSKELDYLTLCAIAAQQAGMSYGKYMAMHNCHPPIQAAAEDVEAPQGIVKVCSCCGKEFYNSTRYRKVYCSYECQMRAAGRRASAKFRAKAAETGNGESHAG